MIERGDLNDSTSTGRRAFLRRSAIVAGSVPVLVTLAAPAAAAASADSLPTLTSYNQDHAGVCTGGFDPEDRAVIQSVSGTGAPGTTVYIYTGGCEGLIVAAGSVDSSGTFTATFTSSPSGEFPSGHSGVGRPYNECALDLTAACSTDPTACGAVYFTDKTAQGTGLPF